MKNKLNDLNNYLFEQIENINGEDLTPEELQTSITKAEAITKIGESIIKNAELQLKAATMLANAGLLKTENMQLLLGVTPENKNEKV